jgi:uncharacterized protein YvpB
MDFENFATNISDALPSFEIRFWWVLILFFVIVISLILQLIFIKKYKIFTIWYGILFLLLIFFGVAPFVISLSIFEYFSLDKTYLLQIPLWLISLFGFTTSLVYWIFNLKKKSKKDKNEKVNMGDIFNGIQLVILAISLLYLVFITLSSMLAKPYIVLANEDNEANQRVEIIEIESSVPLSKNNIQVNMSPDEEYTVEYENFLFFNNLITGFTIQPVQNYSPNTKVVTYITGISNLWPGGKIHEQNLDFFTPPLPDINTVNFPEKANNIPVNTEIGVQLTNPTGEYVYWDIEIEPSAKYEIIEDNDQLRIKLIDLDQGTNYKVMLFQAEKTFNIQTGESLSIGELKQVKTFEFKTTPPPHVKSFNRQSGFMSVDEPLDIIFTNKISEENIQSFFNIEPSIEGSLEVLEDGKTLRFTPSKSFVKDTDYQVTLKKGLRNSLGGQLESNINLEFSTPGYLYISSVYPRNYSTEISRKLSSIRITFNQPVNHSSVQSNFSISPSVDGTFSWSGNSLYYNLSDTLSYGTRYTVSVKNGVKSLYGYDLQSNFNSVFTTEEEVFILDVPQYYQGSQRFGCNLFATKMVLGYKGISVSTDNIKNYIGVGEDPNSSWVEGYGTHWNPIASYLNSRGVSNSIRRGWNVSDMLTEVSKGHPVILYWYNAYTTPKGTIELEGGYTGYNGMHSEVVVGFVGKVDSPTNIILNDPWRGRRYLSLGTFNSLWSCIGNTAIVVY